MQQPPIEKLRRLALGIALLILVVSVASYGVRAWRARQARKSVPVVASDVQQQAQGFTFARSEAGRTLFVIQALRTVERQGRKIMLEGVSVVVYGRDGTRADEIHTGRCQYEAAATEQVFCPDAVTFELGAPPRKEEQQKDTGHRLRIQTAGVRFDQGSGVARTAEPVTFRFPEGHGRGVGLRYQPGQPRLILERDVEIVLERVGQPSLSLRGESLGYNSREHLLRLRPLQQLVAGDRELVAGELTMQLNSAYQLERLEAAGAVTARARPAGRLWQLRAAQATAEFTPGQGIARLRVSGRVEVEAQGLSQEALTGEQAEIFFDAHHRWAERVVATGDARVRSVLPHETRELAAEKLELKMRAGGRAAEQVATHARGILALTQASGVRRQIEADQIELKFDERSRLTALAAHGSVEAAWQVPGKASWRTASAELHAEFSREGGLARVEQWGGFRFREQDREATAGRAQYEAARGVFVLTEQPVLWDTTLRLSADQVELSQRDERLEASGNVRTTYAGRGTTPLFGSALPVHVVADAMQGERGQPGRPGWARFTGRARLWQGPNRIEAAMLDLFEEPRQLVARGRVSSLLVERGVRSPDPATQVVRIASERFTYLESFRRGLYEENVRGEGVFGSLRAQRLEVFLAERGAEGGWGVERARASGRAAIEQPGRRAQAENAEYTVENETVILWGGEPQLADVQYGTAQGARLTFHLADDTISIESGTGSRTITRRTWAR